MHSSDRIEAVTRLSAPLAASLGLELWGVEILGAARPLVRVYVDAPTPPAPLMNRAGEEDDNKAANATKDGTEYTREETAGVTVDQCAELSRLLGLSLDVEDMFTSGWTLEVSSPGLERPFFHLEQLRAYLGRELEVALSAPLESWPNRKKFHGVLSRITDSVFTLDLPLAPAARRTADEPASADIPWSAVRKAVLVHNFPEPGAKRNGNGRRHGTNGRNLPHGGVA